MLTLTTPVGLLAHAEPSGPPGASGSLATVAVMTAATVLALLAGVLLAGTAGRAGRGRGRLAPTVAGALLLALVLGDLLPDALQDGTDLPGGAPTVVAVAVLALAAGGRMLGRRSPAGDPGAGEGAPGPAAVAVGCCSAGAGTLAGLALATHGAAEGLVVGLGADLRAGTALAVVSVALHRLAEGFALGTALRGSATRRPRAVGLTACAALSPVVGGAAAGALTLGESAVAVVSAGLAGLLTAVAASLLAGVLRPRQDPAGAVAPVTVLRAQGRP